VSSIGKIVINYGKEWVYVDTVGVIAIVECFEIFENIFFTNLLEYLACCWTL
jgi:hypothetical protein